MTVSTGKDGNVKIGTDAVANIKSWTLETTAETQDASKMGTAGNWRDHLATLKSWAGSVDAWWDAADMGQAALSLGDTVTLDLFPTGDASAQIKFSGSAIITGTPKTAAVDGLIEVSFSFQGTGALAESTVV